MLKDIITTTRTYRKFDENHVVSSDTLTDLIELARLSGSARNCQPWQYILVNDTPDCEEVFPNLFWAGYLPDWKGPEAGERPTAYIICILNHTWLKGSEKEAYFDLGIASQNMLLGATEAGLGGCRFASFKPELKNKFQLSEDQSLELVIALGKPVEVVKLQDGLEDGGIAYWRDDKQVHHVPKRALADIII